MANSAYVLLDCENFFILLLGVPELKPTLFGKNSPGFFGDDIFELTSKNKQKIIVAKIMKF